MLLPPFVAAYEVQWGTFPGKVVAQAEIWAAMINPIPENLLPKLIDYVNADMGGSRFRPNGNTIMRAWRRLRAETEANAGKTKIESCTLCDNTGTISVPTAWLEDVAGGQWIFDCHPNVTLELHSWPCRCSLGRKFESKRNLPPSACDMARAIYADYRQAAGHRTEGCPVNRAEFLEKNFGCSPVGIMRDVLVKSHIDRGEIDAVTAYPDKKSCMDRVLAIQKGRGATIEYWKKLAEARRMGKVAAPAPIPTIDDDPQPTQGLTQVGESVDDIIAGEIVKERFAVGGEEEGDTSFDFGQNAPEETEPKTNEDVFYPASVSDGDIPF
jgi:hypothetical protein